MEIISQCLEICFVVLVGVLERGGAGKAGGGHGGKDGCSAQNTVQAPVELALGLDGIQQLDLRLPLCQLKSEVLLGPSNPKSVLERLTAAAPRIAPRSPQTTPVSSPSSQAFRD